MLKDERAGNLNLSSSILDVIYQVVHIFLAQLDVVLLAEIINCARNLVASIFTFLRSKNLTESAAGKCTA